MSGRDFATAIATGIGTACVGLILGVMAAAIVIWSLNTLTGRHHEPCVRAIAVGDR